ncbi:hypothetical protein BJX61DRAFT_546734 [Aspergillus egyptiacus]|nr:hypothetical protein BJX61DRAFT_546734 [Aspergillus egyptiacus]
MPASSHTLHTEHGPRKTILDSLSQSLLKASSPLHHRALHYPPNTTPTIFTLRSTQAPTDINALGAAIRTILQKYITTTSDARELPFHLKLAIDPKPKPRSNHRDGLPAPPHIFITLLVDIPTGVPASSAEIADELFDVSGELWEFETPAEDIHPGIWRLGWFDVHVAQTIWPCVVWSNVAFDDEEEGGNHTCVVHAAGGEKEGEEEEGTQLLPVSGESSWSAGGCRTPGSSCCRSDGFCYTGLGHSQHVRQSYGDTFIYSLLAGFLVVIGGNEITMGCHKHSPDTEGTVKDGIESETSIYEEAAKYTGEHGFKETGKAGKDITEGTTKADANLQTDIEYGADWVVQETAGAVDGCLDNLERPPGS